MYFQGDKSNVAKLRQWLTKWSANEKPVFAGKFNRGTMDGSGMKAALLSGPPGVGKTTTAHLVAKELYLDASSFSHYGRARHQASVFHCL